MPRPAALERFHAAAPVIDGAVLLGSAGAGRLAAPVAKMLAAAGLTTLVDETAPAAVSTGAGPATRTVDLHDMRGEPLKGLIFDASAIGDSTGLAELHRFFHPTVRALTSNGRVVVLAIPPEEAGNTHAATAQRALEGFTRSLAKELGARGATVQLVQVSPGAEEQIDSTLRFLLSPRSAYVSGQVIRIAQGVCATPQIDWDRPLQGRVALVTGAARGIGAAIARTLARDGAEVVGLDIPQATQDLQALMQSLGASALTLDITAPEAPEQIATRFPQGLDILIHNAGVTRDRTIAKMPAERWSELMEINLCSEERINDELTQRGLIASNGRIVCVSSMAGIAGNPGQTNYATSKAGVIGMVQALASPLAELGVTINAVAPGFIETAMTQAMPFGPREAGRRLNSLRQGGLPVDVAETIAWLASPASTGVNGNVIRVCGQSLIGA
jgi:3-oxoacyl-[acyl-carrier protein] reductase